MTINEEKMLKTEFFSDQRGEIYINKIKNKEFNILFSRAGAYRAGHYHSAEQHGLILEGEVEITLWQNDQDIIRKYGPNELIVIRSNVPHLYKFLIDTVMIEWLTGTYKPRYYKPYRKIINRQLEKLK